MKPVKTVDPPEWMRAPQTRAVMAALNGGGAEPQALFVGGCVRNMLLGRPVTDIDIAARHEPPETMARLQAAGIRAIPTGIAYGTVTAAIDGKVFEITSLRSDVETDGRRAVVSYTADWLRDAQRRDFTMNTLLADPEGRIYDPLRSGLSDLESGRIVFVGNPAERIAEDYLRILRFFRFQAWYGGGAPDAQALAACHAAAGRMSILSRERITHEVLKILEADGAANALDLIFKNNILPDLSFKEYQLQVMAVLCALGGALPTRVLTLCGINLKNLEKVQSVLLLTGRMRKDISAIHDCYTAYPMGDNHGVKVAVYRCGRVAAEQACLLKIATGQISEPIAPDILDLIRTWEIPVFPVSGSDLIKTGLQPGPEMGERLKAMELAWIESGFTAISPPAAGT